MRARRGTGFRFAPPPFEVTPALAWVLARAFALEPVETARPDPRAVLELARALHLAPRIAARTSEERLESELGPDAVPAWRQVRVEAAAMELRLDAALESAARVCAALDAPCALLKGRALVLGGYAKAGSRPATDVDLLVPEGRLAEAQRALEAADFRNPGGSGYEHQAPLLLHRGGGALELHRSLPGVRIDGKHSASFETLAARGLLEPSPAAGRLLLPARSVATAHALVHTLAQHAFVSAHSGFLMIADLIDLGCASGTIDAEVLSWVEADGGAREIAAALELARELAADGPRRLAARGDDAGRLAAHFVAAALDPDYGQALKLRMLERPLSDRPRAVARLLLLARALVPPRGGGPAAWLRRPFEMAGRWRRARRRRPAGA